MRYVSPDDGVPIERFLTFPEIGCHTGESMSKMVHNYLTSECKKDFSKCRGQSYDNDANMSGKYKGMQEIILKINKYAMYIQCFGQSLNLVGRTAINFWGIFQEIYLFFHHLHIDGQYCCHSSKMIQNFQSLCQRLDGKHIQWPQVQ